MKVWPKNDQLRKLLRHPTGGAFPVAGIADWPDDSFTHRLVQDGDVLTEDPASTMVEQDEVIDEQVEAKPPKPRKEK